VQVLSTSVRIASRVTRACEVGERGTQPGPVDAPHARASFDAPHRRIAQTRADLRDEGRTHQRLGGDVVRGVLAREFLP
jgi:hypothetical protein